MAEVTKGQANLNTVLGSLGTAGFAGFNLGNLFGGNHCNDPDSVPVNRYEAKMSERIAELETEIKLRDANTFTMGEMGKLRDYVEARFERVEKELCDQKVYNATLNGVVGCIQNQIAQLQGLTKIVIPTASICPEPMARYNSWVAPKAEAPAAG